MDAAVPLPAPPVPVLAVCGWSGAGKTTLLESAIPRLVAAGLAVAVIKHDAHGAELDRAGKDSDRLFRAGADVVLSAPHEGFSRSHNGSPGGLDATLTALARDHDLVLVEGHKGTPLPKLWLAGASDASVPGGTSAVRATLPWRGERLEAFLSHVEAVVGEHFAARPLLGGVLVGGASARMGRPKQLVQAGARSFVELVVAALEPSVQRVAALGAGALPPALSDLPRLPDPPGVAGPLAGILAALRWAPAAAWVIVACDLPRLTPGALEWLVAQRRPGRWAVLPRVRRDTVEPVAAAYEPQALPLLEGLAAGREWRPHLLAEHPKVATPTVPSRLAGAWRGVDTPDDLARL